MYSNYLTKDYTDYIADAFSSYDIIIGLIATLIFIFIGKRLNRKYNKGTHFFSFFKYGLLFRLLCSWFAMLIYRFYYNGGDTFMYYSAVIDISHADWSYWFEFLTDIWQTHHKYSHYGNINTNAAYYMGSISNAGVARVGLIFNLFCFNSYTAISLCCAFFAFIGTWMTYKAFLNFYPLLYRELGIFILFYPSAIFWSSDLAKESICIFALGVMFYFTSSVLFMGKRTLFSFFAILASSIALYIIKPYIIVAFAPALSFWIFLQYNHKINNKILRRFSTVLVIAVSILGGSLLFKRLTESGETKKYATEAIIESIVTSQKNLTNDKNGGSKFTLGSLDPSPLGLAKMFPAAVNASLYRPYLWETRNPVMMLSALESTFLLLITITIIFRFKFRIRKIFATIFSSPLMTFSLIFTLIFAGTVGISVFNFGALVRYKVPCLPFFGLVLAELWSKSKKNKLPASKV